MLYAVEGETNATGQALGANGAGDIGDAGVLVGDAQNLLASSNYNPFETMLGIAVIF